MKMTYDLLTEKANELIERLRRLRIKVGTKDYEFVYTYPPLYSLKPIAKGAYNDIFSPDPIKNASLYFHIPFCKSMCDYCYYYKIKVKPGDGGIADYLGYLSKEVELFMKNSEISTIDSIYIGGGTPLLLNDNQLRRLFLIIGRIIKNLGDNKFEFTIETTPEMLLQKDIDARLRLLEKSGINRLSIGIQTFDGCILGKVRRDYVDTEKFKTIINDIRKKISNINIDLIYGLPGQTFESIKKDIEIATGLDIPSITYYRLWFKESVSPVKPFMEYYDVNAFPKAAEIVAMKIFISDLLENAGYNEYMSSWYIRNQANKNKYQEKCWRNSPYIGFGVGAYSFLNNVQFKNRCFLDDYYDDLSDGLLPICSKYELENDEIKMRELMLGLKFRNGIEIDQTILTPDIKDKLKVLCNEKLLENEKSGRIRFTKDGYYVADDICRYLFNPRHILQEGEHRYCVCGLERRNIWKEEINVYKSESFDKNQYKQIMKIPEDHLNRMMSCIETFLNNSLLLNSTRDEINVLSLGVGDGRIEIPFYKLLERQCNKKRIKVRAYDINEDLFSDFKAACKKINSINFEFNNKDIIYEVFKPGCKFDIITMFNFLYHLDKPAAFRLLKRLEAVLREDSIVMLSFSGGWLGSLYERDEPNLEILKKIKHCLNIGYFESYITNWVHEYFCHGWKGHMHEFNWPLSLTYEEFLQTIKGPPRIFGFSELIERNYPSLLSLPDDAGLQEEPKLWMGELLLIAQRIAKRKEI